MNTKKINAGNVKMIAHRGLSGLEKENTCPAFVAAGNRSYYGVETDVHVTKDGKFVIIHDETTERISNGECNINVEENDYSLLENIVLPDVDGTTNRRDIRIPLLKDYINICKKYNLDLDIYYKKLTKENVALLHSKGIGVNCWTCDDCADGEALVEMGVDYITSNILE